LGRLLIRGSRRKHEQHCDDEGDEDDAEVQVNDAHLRAPDQKMEKGWYAGS
jgi:hypothetical protein